jgi:hypothetical protein
MKPSLSEKLDEIHMVSFTSYQTLVYALLKNATYTSYVDLMSPNAYIINEQEYAECKLHILITGSML